MKRKTKVDAYIFSGNASANIVIEIDAIEEGDLKKEAVFLHQLLYDNLPGETYRGVFSRMKSEIEKAERVRECHI